MSEPSHCRHPVEEIEPDESTDAYREAAKLFSRIINQALIVITSAKHPRAAAWQVAFALGAPVCAGESMTSRARQLGITKAAISKGAKAFQRANALPASQYMKSDEASKSYTDARNRQLSA